jgi:hypothetical protein
LATWVAAGAWIKRYELKEKHPRRMSIESRSSSDGDSRFSQPRFLASVLLDLLRAVKSPIRRFGSKASFYSAMALVMFTVIYDIEAFTFSSSG